MRAFTVRIGAIVLAGGAVAAVALLPAPWPAGAAVPVAPAPVELPAAPLHLECPALQPPSSEGELRADGSSLSDDWEGKLVAATVLATGAASPSLHYAPLVEQDEDGSPPADDDQSTGVSVSGPGAKLEVATIRGGVVSTAGAVAPGFQVAAAVELVSSTGVYAGLVASPCPAGSTDQWVVGASATVANGGILRLHNLSARVASVELTMHGARGPIPSAGRVLRISAYTSVEVQLASLAPGEARPALHVESSAPVAATLLAYETTGLHPAGLSAVHGTTPDLQQVVIVPPGGQVLRIVNPAQEAVTATVSFVEAAGTSALPGAEQVEVAPGSVAEIPLDLLRAGALVVTASQPVVASARAYASLQVGELDAPAQGRAPAAGATASPASTSSPASAATADARPAPSDSPRPSGAPAQSTHTQAPAPTRAATPAQTAVPSQSPNLAQPGASFPGSGHGPAPSVVASVPFHPAEQTPPGEELSGLAAPLAHLANPNAPRDHSWSAAAGALTRAVAMAPSSGTLVLANPGREAATVKISGGASPVEVAVAAGTVTTVEVVGVFELVSTKAVYASLLLGNAGKVLGIEVLPVYSSATAADSVELAVTR